MPYAENMLNSIRSYTLSGINSSIVSISEFASVPFDSAPNGGSTETPEFDPKYIVCGETKCGTDLLPPKEICGE